MSRFSFYTDIHLSGQTPRHRVDDYPMALLSKLEEIYKKSEDGGCDFIIFGGDLFNTHRIYSYDVIAGAMDVIGGSDLKTYCVIGQHDLKGYNRKSYSTSALAFVDGRCENLEVLWEPADVGGCWLCPSHVWEDPFEPQFDAREDRFNVLIAHHLLTNKKAMFDVINTVEYSKTCNFDLVLSGDLHDGYPVHEANGTHFCNPGSIARRSTSDMHRHPQMAFVDVWDGTPTITIERLECGRVSEEVFGESIAEIIKVKNDFNADNLLDNMQSFEADAVDIFDLIRSVGNKEGVADDVMDYLLSKREADD